MDRRRRLLDAWERRCRAQGDAARCSGADALFLVRAVSNALDRGSGGTSELGRAARTWGAGLSAPVEALSAVVQLREAVVSLPDGLPAGMDAAGPVVAQVFDHVMMEAVDAASANLRSAARVDSLTGCANRRALDEELGHALASARRSGLDLTVAIVDLDGLKAVNDTEGHAAGDAALVSLVATLRSVLREADTLYRTGGDEFVVLTPFTDAAGARALMRRAEHMDGPAFSWGVASTAELGSVAAGQASAAGRLPQPDGAAASVDADALVLFTAADLDLYARRRARRRQELRTRRKRRAVAVATVAASAATVASGAGLAVALTGGSSGPPGRSSSTTEALAGGSLPTSTTPGHPRSRGDTARPSTAPGTAPAPGAVTPAGATRPAGAGTSPVVGALASPALVTPIAAQSVSVTAPRPSVSVLVAASSPVLSPAPVAMAPPSVTVHPAVGGGQGPGAGNAVVPVPATAPAMNVSNAAGPPGPPPWAGKGHGPHPGGHKLKG